MSFIRSIAVVFSAALVTWPAFAQDDHQAHHPASSSAPAPAAAQAPSSESMGTQMKSMQAMHEKMMAAKTPEDRKALMAEHMQTMRGGMAMMGAMKESAGSAPPAERQRMLEMRMDMCQSMMQMMMDRMPESAK
ncbi:TPA: hypothetical protein VDV07_000196 [Pseudomonas aeruginosa]|nr:hypothetical protein [Pseudomonas aeruginosa]